MASLMKSAAVSGPGIIHLFRDARGRKRRRRTTSGLRERVWITWRSGGNLEGKSTRVMNLSPSSSGRAPGAFAGSMPVTSTLLMVGRVWSTTDGAILLSLPSFSPRMVWRTRSALSSLSGVNRWDVMSLSSGREDEEVDPGLTE